jgi:hypothetical protein
MIKRLSTSVARDAFTRRMRPSRSAASGVKICERIEARASASRSLEGGLDVSKARGERGGGRGAHYCCCCWSSFEDAPPLPPDCSLSWARRAFRIWRDLVRQSLEK